MTAHEQGESTMSEPPRSTQPLDGEQEVRLTARSRAEVLAQVAREVAAPCPDLDAVAIEAALQAREELQSTAVGEGLALPHAVLNELDSPRVLKVSFDQPVPWDEDGGEVERCVVILVPPGKESAHLELVSQAVRGHQTHQGE